MGNYFAVPNSNRGLNSFFSIFSLELILSGPDIFMKICSLFLVQCLLEYYQLSNLQKKIPVNFLKA